LLRLGRERSVPKNILAILSVFHTNLELTLTEYCRRVITYSNSLCHFQVARDGRAKLLLSRVCTHRRPRKRKRDRSNIEGRCIVLLLLSPGLLCIRPRQSDALLARRGQRSPIAPTDVGTPGACREPPARTCGLTCPIRFGNRLSAWTHVRLFKRIKHLSCFGVLNVGSGSSYYQNKEPDYGRHLQFQPRICSGKRAENRNAQPVVVQSTDTTDDLDRSKLSQLISRFLDFRDTDHCEPAPGRPQ